MNIKDMHVKDLKPYENNPRFNEDAVDKVAESIKQFGFKVPIIIDENRVIVTGHTRLLAAMQLKMEQVPVIIADDLSEQQIKAFRIADNRVAEFSEWDFEKLDIELEELSNDNFDLGELDFEFDDVEQEEEVEAQDDNFDIVVPEQPNAKIGEVYKLGNHRLMCGDSTKKQDVNKLVDGESVDLFITDPPYNVSYTGKTDEMLTIENDDMDDEDFRGFLYDVFKTADEVMKPGASFYIWHADSEGYNFRGACRDVDWKVRQCLIWVKNSMVMGRQDYHWKHEPCLYGWKPGAAHTWHSDRKQTTVLEFDRPTKNIEHPTMKPIPLFDYQIKNNTQKNDKVLDLFGGSGTTLIACEQSERISYTMELDPKYVDVIINRWEEYTGEKAEIVEG